MSREATEADVQSQLARLATLRAQFPELPEQPDARTVFLKLRELRNTW